MRAFQTHYPTYFKDKTKKDKDLLVAEYMRSFGGIEDQLFLIAASRTIKESIYFPTIREIQERVRFAKIEADRKALDEYYYIKNLKEYASYSDERCEFMIELETAFEFPEPLDWFAIREEARQELGRRRLLNGN